MQEEIIDRKVRAEKEAAEKLQIFREKKASNHQESNPEKQGGDLKIGLAQEIKARS